MAICLHQIRQCLHGKLGFQRFEFNHIQKLREAQTIAVLEAVGDLGEHAVVDGIIKRSVFLTGI